MNATLAIALNTFREVLRSRILYSIVFVAFVVSGAAALFGSVTIGSQVKVIKDFGFFSLSFFGTTLAVSAGTNLLNRELKQKTIYNILSKPVARWQFVLGKYLGLTLVLFVLETLMAVALFLFAARFEDRPDPLILQGYLYTLLEVNVVCALTIFFSSVVVTTTLTGLFTFGTYIAGRSLRYLDYFLDNPDYAGLAPFVVWSKKLLPDLSMFNVGDYLVYGHTLSAHDFGHAAIYSLSYGAVVVILASMIFSLRELK